MKGLDVNEKKNKTPPSPESRPAAKSKPIRNVRMSSGHGMKRERGMKIEGGMKRWMRRSGCSWWPLSPRCLVLGAAGLWGQRKPRNDMLNACQEREGETSEIEPILHRKWATLLKGGETLPVLYMESDESLDKSQ